MNTPSKTIKPVEENSAEKETPIRDCPFCGAGPEIFAFTESNLDQGSISGPIYRWTVRLKCFGDCALVMRDFDSVLEAVQMWNGSHAPFSGDTVNLAAMQAKFEALQDPDEAGPEAEVSLN